MTCPLCDPEGYRFAMYAHAESHEQAGSDPEECDKDDCPHWPDIADCNCGALEALA